MTENGAFPLFTPNATPANVSYILFPVTAPTSTAAPSGIITLTDDNGNPVTSITSLAIGTTTLPNNEVNIYETNFYGNFTLGGNCASISAFSFADNYGGYAQLEVNPTAVGTCTETISDGTNTVSLPTTVTTTGFTGS